MISTSVFTSDNGTSFFQLSFIFIIKLLNGSINFVIYVIHEFSEFTRKLFFTEYHQFLLNSSRLFKIMAA